MGLYPGALPAAGTANPASTLVVAGHTALHNTEADEARALATKVGTGSSTPASGLLLRGNGGGTSAWAQANLIQDVTGVLPQANGGTGQTGATGTGVPVYQAAPIITTPTITIPVISDFTSANHDHSSTSKGGSLGAVTATSVATNTLAANGGNHMTLSAGTNKLVKSTVLRQDDTTGTYQVGNTVRLTGWGVGNPGATGVLSEVVTFGVTFLQPPIVLLVYGGDDTAASTAYGQGAVDDAGAVTAWAHTPTTTNFTARLQRTGAWNGTTTVFYQWSAEGEIA